MKKFLLTVITTISLLVPSITQSQTVELELGYLNVGPVVTEEVDNFVRFGGNGGQATYLAGSIVDDKVYGSLTVAGMHLYVWPTTDTIITSGGLKGKASDPTKSRFHYRVQGEPKDFFLWTQLTAGVRYEHPYGDFRLGGGIVQLAATRHNWWGATTGPKPVVETLVTVDWEMLSLRCKASGVYVGEPFGRWSVLEHAARDVGDSSVKRTISPLSCGLAITTDHFTK